MNCTCLTIAICDDNSSYLTILEATVEDAMTGIPHRILCFTDPAELLSAAKTQFFAIAILDIQMPKQDGISLGKALLQSCPDCHIIFLTAYLPYAQDVYDVDHFAFVLKSDMNTRLPAVLRRLTSHIDEQHPAMVIINSSGTSHIIPQRSILSLERKVRISYLYTEAGIISTSEKLEDILQRLDGNTFCQCHKSYAINWSFVVRYDKSCLILKNGRRISVSRSYAPKVKDAFLNYVHSISLKSRF